MISVLIMGLVIGSVIRTRDKQLPESDESCWTNLRNTGKPNTPVVIWWVKLLLWRNENLQRHAASPIWNQRKTVKNTEVHEYTNTQTHKIRWRYDEWGHCWGVMNSAQHPGLPPCSVADLQPLVLTLPLLLLLIPKYSLKILGWSPLFFRTGLISKYFPKKYWDCSPRSFL